MIELREQIRKPSLELRVEERFGEPISEINPFNKENLTFDYSKVNVRYHASSNADDELTLYKGALRIKNVKEKGLLSMALIKGIYDYVIEMKSIIEGDNDALIDELFEQHTGHYIYTPLLSATFNPELAQVFAPTYSLFKKCDKTIYQIKIKANRCVIDTKNLGKSGSSRELFILGAIFPEEISAIKKINDDNHSELLGTFHKCQIVKSLPDKDSINTKIKDLNNWIFFN